MCRKSAIVFVALLFTLNVLGQNKPVKFEELKDVQSRQAKPVVVLIMTQWCKYCHAMQNTMLKNSRVSNLLSNEFYTVFLDAEERRDIFFAGRTFKYKSGVNELAQQLAPNEGRVSYPTLSILNSNNEIIYQHDGYLSEQALLFILKKIAEN